ncbi:hypothetical protein [Microbacterium rhizophilus]|uniref:hypothetical protein n=1 Tax=Microbacterium rhizophilus TaxID=3138934 RepID=UPI0031EF0DF0
MGFSPLGLIVSVAVLAPSLLLIRHPPRDGLPDARPPRWLGVLERAGQALCLVMPVIVAPGRIAPWWSLAVATAVIPYWALWARYLRGGRTAELLYRPLWRVPVPMAVLPVLAFLAAGAWLANPWIALAALVLAAGHVPVSLIAARAVRA